MASRKRAPNSRNNGGGSKQGDANELVVMRSIGSVDETRPKLPFLGSPGSKTANQIRIKMESEVEEEVSKLPPFNGGNPDPFWVQEWRSMDLKSVIASQVEFFNTCPRFNNNDSNHTYILFFKVIQFTFLQARAAPLSIAMDATANRNFKPFRTYFEDFSDQCRWMLRSDLDRIDLCDYRQCLDVADLENALQGFDQFLSMTKDMATSLCLHKEWEATWTHIRAAKKCVVLAKEHGLFDSVISSVQDLQPAHTSLNLEGPLSAEMLKMDYEFTDSVWCQWIESCVSYFEYWTADSTRKYPAEDFIRHLSHYRLAMELFLKHESIAENKLSALVKAAKKYMSQYSECAAVQLETKYATLKENVKNTSIYLTEARFWQLADDIEVFMNETPSGIETETWHTTVPVMLPRDKVWAAKNAINVLYKEFQIKRYPEDEVAYLWLLTWRNIKHLLPYLTSPSDLDDIRQVAGASPVTIEARDLALPFVESNLIQLLTIVRKDNDALYQKEIQTLIGDYCAHIDRYVRGQGEGQERIYEQFASLSNTKRIPFVYMVRLEETLLTEEASPVNGAQMIAHRVVKRLNHIMEGPKEFKRWELMGDSAVKTYSPTSTWVEEQQALKSAAGFDLGDRGESFRGPSQSPAAGAGAGGGDDGDGNDRRNQFSANSAESSGSDEEIEVVSPGGTKRMEKRKKAKRFTPPLPSADALTKVKLELISELSKGADFSSTHAGPSPKVNGGDEDESDTIEPGVPFIHEDSLGYHRRRLRALRVEQHSAVPNAQYPLPETAAPQRAVSLQITRELADSGIYTDGPRPEDVQNYISPPLRLPLTEEEVVAARRAQAAQPHLFRRVLTTVRDSLRSPFSGSSSARSSRYSSPRVTPNVPESNAQRARREREASEVTPRVLRRRADEYSVRKSPARGGRPRHSAYNVRSAYRSGNATSPDDPELPWSTQTQANKAAATGDSDSSSHTPNQENKTPSPKSSNKNSSQENESPGNDSNQENQGPAGLNQQAQGNANDWNSPSPPRRHDGTMVEGSPIRQHNSPTAGRINTQTHTNSRHWWTDPLEGTRGANRQPGVAWKEPPSKDGKGAHTSKSGSSPHPSRAARTERSTSSTSFRASPMRDVDGNIIPSAQVERRSPLGELTLPAGTAVGAEYDRAWSWNVNPITGLPEREFNIYINPDTIESTHPSGLGEPLFVQDPLNPGLLTTNPRFSPEILRLISAAGRDDHGQINVCVPAGWIVHVGPNAARNARGQAPSPPLGSHDNSAFSSSSGGAPPGGQQVSIAAPGFAIYEDGSSHNGSVRDRSNAPRTLGLIDDPAEERPAAAATSESSGAQSNAENTQPVHANNGQGTGCGCRCACSVANNPNPNPGPAVNSASTRSDGSTIPPRGSGKGSGSASGRKGGGSNNFDVDIKPSKPQSKPRASTSSSSSPTIPETQFSPPRDPNPPSNNPRSKSKSRSKAPSPSPSPEMPWYTTWRTSTVVRLRAELAKRGIDQRKLKLKKAMIERLKRDDGENGVGGVYEPAPAEEGGLGDEDDDDDDDDDDDEEEAGEEDAIVGVEDEAVVAGGGRGGGGRVERGRDGQRMVGGKMEGNAIEDFDVADNAAAAAAMTKKPGRRRRPVRRNGGGIVGDEIEQEDSHHREGADADADAGAGAAVADQGIVLPPSSSSAAAAEVGIGARSLKRKRRGRVDPFSPNHNNNNNNKAGGEYSPAVDLDGYRAIKRLAKG